MMSESKKIPIIDVNTIELTPTKQAPSTTTSTIKSIPNSVKARGHRSSSIYDPYKCYSQSHKVSRTGFNKEYLKSLVGLLRFLLILTKICGLITVIIIRTNPEYNNEKSLPIAMIVFFIIGLILTVVIFFSLLFNVIYSDKLFQINWKIVFSTTDTVLMIAMTVLGILSAINATKYAIYNKHKHEAIYAVAAIFGFICAFLHAALASITFLSPYLNHELIEYVASLALCLVYIKP